MSFLFQVPSFKIRVCAISGRDLAAKDRNGLSDPFLKFKLGEQKHSTHVCLETLSPTWDDKFDLVLPVSKPPTHLVIVCWDKDRFGRDFMGEIKIPIADLFMRNGRPRLFENNGPQWHKLETRGKEVVSGEIQLHWGFKCNKRDLQRHLDWCLLLEGIFGRKLATDMIKLQKEDDAAAKAKLEANTKVGDAGIMNLGGSIVSRLTAEALRRKEQMMKFTEKLTQSSSFNKTTTTETADNTTEVPSETKKPEKKPIVASASTPEKKEKKEKKEEKAEEGKDAKSKEDKKYSEEKTNVVEDKKEDTSAVKQPEKKETSNGSASDDKTEPTVTASTGITSEQPPPISVYGAADHHGYLNQEQVLVTDKISMPVPQIDGVETGYNHLYTSVSYQTTAIAQNTVQPASSFSEGMAPMSMPTVEIPSFTAEERQQILAMPEPYMYYSAAEDVKPLIVIAQEAAQATEIGPPTGITANEMVISAVSAAAKAAADNPSAQARMIRVESDDEDELAADGSNVKDTYSARAIPSRSMSLPIPSPEVLGVVFVDVVAAKDLPPLKNFLHTGFDMDPFAIVTFGRNTFRTQAIRHTLNPIWNERLYFHLAKHELSYPITFTIMDKDKFSNNDRVATASLSIMDLLSGSNVNIDDYTTGRNDANNVIPNDMDTPQEHTLTMLPAKDSGWEGHCTITFRVRFIRYTTLRRRFWHSLTEQYDSDGNQRINRVELLTMLDSLGSTLTEATIDGFFRRFNKDPAQGDELEFDELAMCLEQHLQTQHGPRPVEIGSPSSDVTSSSNSNEGLTVAAEPTGRKRIFSFNKEVNNSSKEEVAESGEQVIRIRECPICHKPDLLGKDDVSILTHVAICTLNDPEKVDRFMMGNFVTEAQAQRRWFNKLAAFVSYGSYSIGKNNANIIVLDRATGQLIEEKMPTYIRMGIRMLYQSIGSKTTVESKSIRNLFASLSIKQGKKFTNPESVRDIAPFIEFHQLNVNEIADPLDSFANFNEFFYRKLKPGARHIAGRNDPRVAVSPADARILCFPTVTQATQLWIKGDLFTLPRLLDDAELAARYEGGALCIFRLAPQDYHRFHIPVDGVFSEPKPIDGAYYTVNPMAIRSSLDVYGENKRIVSVLESEKFGRVTYVCIGAMLVGSIVLTSEPGRKYIHGDEHGYFAFGGSTIVMLFEPNKIQLDADLLENASKPLETLVKMGESIGKAIQE